MFPHHLPSWIIYNNVQGIIANSVMQNKIMSLVTSKS
jgi:hypothetical protein